MTHYSYSNLLTYLDVSLCCLVLVLIYRRGRTSDFKFLAAYLYAKVLSFLILIPVLQLAGHKMERHLAYHVYFYTYWTSYAVEALLGLGIIYSIYNLAMAPLPGLQRLGGIMFRWATCIAVAVALAMAFGPQLTSTRFIVRFVSQLQQTQSVLTLCMLLFVCLTIRPMGLSHLSKIFGVSIGLGMSAATQLVASAWFPHSRIMFNVVNSVNGTAICVSLAIWACYFAMKEPKRRMIVLPTTSPFLRWNQISQALGDEPGFVALGEVTLDMFDPAEVEIMRRASVKMDAAYGR